jgi:hypothetical protein
VEDVNLATIYSKSDLSDVSNHVIEEAIAQYEALNKSEKA